MRVSEVERDKAMELLRSAIGDGTLRLDEFSARADRILCAETWGEVEGVLADLPGKTLRGLPESPALILRTGSGRLKQEGQWNVPAYIEAQCGIGRIRIDFSAAICRQEQIQLRATCTSLGKIILIVPRGWAVRVDELTTTTGRIINRAKEPHRQGAPLLRISGDIGAGRIKVGYPRGGVRD